MAILSSARIVWTLVFPAALLAHPGVAAGAQERPPSAQEMAVLGNAIRGDFDAADRAIERSMVSPQPDFELFWQYQSFLVNEASQPRRAAVLGEKWLATVRQARPRALGRILKETGLGILFGSFRATHSPADKTRARRLIEESVEVNPDVAESFIHLSLLAALDGQNRLAVSMLARAVETSSDRAQREQLSGMLASARSDATVLVSAARRVYEMGQ